MAQRPIFVPATKVQGWVMSLDTQLEWYPGFAVSQKQKSIASLHQQACSEHSVIKPLEISTKSLQTLGVALSAFNLQYAPDGRQHNYPLEVVFQSSKVFLKGGPFVDLLSVHPKDAKRDLRLRENGPLIAFRLNEFNWPLQPQTLFYDWLYLNAVAASGKGDQLSQYDAFTDIEFNPNRSINCQARSAALYVALQRADKLQQALSSEAHFIELLSEPVQPQVGETGSLF